MSALEKIDFGRAKPVRLTILGSTIGNAVAGTMGTDAQAQASADRVRASFDANGNPLYPVDLPMTAAEAWAQQVQPITPISVNPYDFIPLPTMSGLTGVGAGSNISVQAGQPIFNSDGSITLNRGDHIAIPSVIVNDPGYTGTATQILIYNSSTKSNGQSVNILIGAGEGDQSNRNFIYATPENGAAIAAPIPVELSGKTYNLYNDAAIVTMPADPAAPAGSPIVLSATDALPGIPGLTSGVKFNNSLSIYSDNFGAIHTDVVTSYSMNNNFAISDKISIATGTAPDGSLDLSHSFKGTPYAVGGNFNLNNLDDSSFSASASVFSYGKESSSQGAVVTGSGAKAYDTLLQGWRTYVNGYTSLPQKLPTR